MNSIALDKVEAATHFPPRYDTIQPASTLTYKRAQIYVLDLKFVNNNVDYKKQAR